MAVRRRSGLNASVGSVAAAGGPALVGGDGRPVPAPPPVPARGSTPPVPSREVIGHARAKARERTREPPPPRVIDVEQFPGLPGGGDEPEQAGQRR
eukprot:605150-Alexandrium_andersonii.AAC.1